MFLVFNFLLTINNDSVVEAKAATIQAIISILKKAFLCAFKLLKQF